MALLPTILAVAHMFLLVPLVQLQALIKTSGCWNGPAYVHQEAGRISAGFEGAGADGDDGDIPEGSKDPAVIIRYLPKTRIRIPDMETLNFDVFPKQ